MDRLISQQYSVPNQEYLNTSLASTLVQLSPILPAEGASLVKSVSILLSKLDLDIHDDRLAMALMDTLAEPLTQFMEISAAVQIQVDKIRDDHNPIDNKITDISMRIDGLHAAVIEAQEQSRVVVSIMESMHTTLQNHIKATIYTATNLPPQPLPTPEMFNPNTYAV
ncbi:hypothetical protein PILCRDRAFT_16384 [Piloderma croceum F 1598]|uniref:Uncharacterized protein n=1 Tax=Piloderma croceum (strain F 1598) TaxID=765440 RepID=A0A0C3EHS1_PILCF|nr:hypothetical protein PILCRDRAFT_16384 [Piloderma croceum F 1598]